MIPFLDFDGGFTRKIATKSYFAALLCYGKSCVLVGEGGSTDADALAILGRIK